MVPTRRPGDDIWLSRCGGDVDKADLFSPKLFVSHITPHLDHRMSGTESEENRKIGLEEESFFPSAAYFLVASETLAYFQQFNLVKSSNSTFSAMPASVFWYFTENSQIAIAAQ